MVCRRDVLHSRSECSEPSFPVAVLFFNGRGSQSGSEHISAMPTSFSTVISSTEHVSLCKLDIGLVVFDFL